MICLKPGGACISCDHPGCTRRYHIRCGIKINLIRPLQDMPDDAQEQDNFLVFCDIHDQKQFS